MNREQFENKYKELIIQSPLEDILTLLKKKKNSYTGNKFLLLMRKTKDKFTKTKTAHFLELGYNNDNSYKFVNDFFELALQHERADVIEYMFEHNYLDTVGQAYYLTSIISSEKVLKHILSIKKITNDITSYEYGKMLKQCVLDNYSESFEIICKNNPEKIKLITKEQQVEILLSSTKRDSFDMLVKLLHMKEPLSFDINAENEDIVRTKENLLLLACKNDKTEIIKYLLTSPELTEKADLSKSFIDIKNLNNGKELLDYIIFDLKSPLTANLERVLKDDAYLEIFKKRDLMLKIENKLPTKNEKYKVRKI